MTDTVDSLFDEFASRYARGERPDPREYLGRAGEHRDALRAMIDRHVRASPPPPATEDTKSLIAAWAAGEPPLLELRVRRGLKRPEVVAALARALGIDAAKEPKVAGYYHELETGQLDTAKVDRRVFAVLSDALHARIDDVLAWRAPPTAAGAFYRITDAGLAADAVVEPQRAAPTEAEWDEVDRLFLGGR